MSVWETLKQKFSSRKFWMTLGGAVFSVLNEGMGLGISEQTFWLVWGFITVYVIGEAVVDAKRKS